MLHWVSAVYSNVVARTKATVQAFSEPHRSWLCFVGLEGGFVQVELE
jgi:hypothetical protein